MSLENKLSTYANLKIKQVKFELVEFFAKERADLIHVGILVSILGLLLVFGSLYASLLLNSYLDSEHLGFGITFFFWMISFIVVILFKNTIKRNLFESYANQNIPS